MSRLWAGLKRVVLVTLSYHSGRFCSTIRTLFCPTAEQEKGGDLQRLIVLIPQLQVSVA